MSQQSSQEIQGKQVKLHWLLPTTMQVDETGTLQDLEEHLPLSNLLGHLPIAEFKFFVVVERKPIMHTVFLR